MRKKVGIIKSLFCLLLIFLLSINSFAAIISDNDGSAFITKAEFDALKSSFQSQIDSYNQSIDSKIDGAIASYLAGIKIAKHETRSILFPSSAILCMEPAHQLRYKLGTSYVTGLTGKMIYQNTTARTDLSREFMQPRLFIVKGDSTVWDGSTVANPFHKLLVSNIDVGKKIAKWDGYEIDGREKLSLKTDWEKRTSYYWNSISTNVGTASTIGLNSTRKNDRTYSINGYSFDTAWNPGGYYAVKNLSTQYGAAGYNLYLIIQSLEIRNKKQIYQNAIIFSNCSNGEFQLNGIMTNNPSDTGYNMNFTDDRKWLWDNNSEVVFKGGISGLIDWLNNNFIGTQTYFGEVNLAGFSHVQNNGNEIWFRGDRTDNPNYYYAPIMQGFEGFSGANGPALNKWNQLYNGSYDLLAAEYNGKTNKPNTLLYDSAGTPHFALTAGFPLLKVSKNEYVEYVIKQKGSFKKMDLYVKLAPFDKDVSPDAETDKSKFLTLSGDKGATFDNTKKCLTINEDQTTISFTTHNDISEEYIWLKWCKNDTTAFGADEHGIELELSTTVEVTRTDE